MMRAILFGGYGVFGSHIARALTAWKIPLTIAGRDVRRAETFAAELGGDCRGRVADLSKADALAEALQGHGLAINAAGPFQHFDAALLDGCVRAGCHYADIADDRAYVAKVRSFGDAFSAHHLTAVYGCSSLPGISGALAMCLRERAEQPVRRVRITLFIGNKNPKGRAAVASFLAGLGRPIAAPRGKLVGFRDREVVPLPAPFGRRGVFNFESPDYDLLPELLSTQDVVVKLGFESRLVTYLFAAAARLGLGGVVRCLPGPLDCAGRAFSGFGSSGGAVLAELFLADGSVRRAALASRTEGQRLAALPCALVSREICQGNVRGTGAATAYEFLGARTFLDLLKGMGFDLHIDAQRQPN